MGYISWTAKEIDIELENIAANNKFDLNYLLERMYGEEYTKDNDKMKSLMQENNYIDSKSYMSSKQESEQFNKKQFSHITTYGLLFMNSLIMQS